MLVESIIIWIWERLLQIIFFQLEPNHMGYYVLLSHIYAVEKKWDNVAKLRPQIYEKGLKKTLAQCS